MGVYMESWWLGREVGSDGGVVIVGLALSVFGGDTVLCLLPSSLLRSIKNDQIISNSKIEATEENDL